MRNTFVILKVNILLIGWKTQDPQESNALFIRFLPNGRHVQDLLPIDEKAVPRPVLDNLERLLFRQSGYFAAEMYRKI